MMKKSHLRRYPGHLTYSSAWQEVAPYSSRRYSQDCLPDRQVESVTGALHLSIFEQPPWNELFRILAKNFLKGESP
jgi:hypothetical protein